MPIVSSEFKLGPVQKSGFRYCTESHVDNEGVEHIIEYSSNVLDDNNAIMLSRVAILNLQLKDIELYLAVFILPWDYVLKHTTNNDLAAFVRQIYKDGVKDDLARTAKRILEWITNGRFTDTQVRNAFGLTLPQWTTLKTKMQNLVANYDAINAATGE